jgi:hypothetical protein
MGDRPQGGSIIVIVHLHLGKAVNTGKLSSWSMKLETGQARYKKGGCASLATPVCSPPCKIEKINSEESTKVWMTT